MATMGKKSLFKSNIEYWLNDLVLRAGLYTNISVGQVDTYGNNISQLIPTSDPSHAGSVYQSAFKNWVYESGIPAPQSGIAPPTVASGVTVNGSFYPEASTTGTYQHFIDWPNGRVVFANTIPAGDTVEADFAYNNITIDFASKLNNENKPLLIETNLKDNPPQSGVDSYPQKNSITLPAIFIDVLKRSSKGYELGDKSLVADFFGVFHIWTRDDFYRDILEDLLAETQHDVIFGINFNNAPYPFVAHGRRNPSWPGYSALADVHGPYFWRRIYMDMSEANKNPPLFEVERSSIKFNVKVYPNF